MVYISELEVTATEFKLHGDHWFALVKHVLGDNDEVLIAGKAVTLLEDCDFEEMPTIKMSVMPPFSVDDLLGCARVLLRYADVDDSLMSDLEFLRHYREVMTGRNRRDWRLYGVTISHECVDLYYQHPELSDFEIIRLQQPPVALSLHFEVSSVSPAEEEKEGEAKGVVNKLLGWTHEKHDKELHAQEHIQVHPDRPASTHVIVHYDGIGMEVITGNYSSTALSEVTLDSLQPGQRMMRIRYDVQAGKTILHRYYHQNDLAHDHLWEILSHDSEDGYFVL